MKRSLLSSVGAITFLALLGSCGQDARQLDQQSALAAARDGGEQGTVVIRGSDGNLLWISWNDYVQPGDVTLFAIHSSDPEYGIQFFCDGVWPPPGDSWMLLDYLEVWNAAQRENLWSRGHAFTRVYRATFPEGFSYEAIACSLLRGEAGVLLAEGTTEWKYGETNACKAGPGRDSYYYRSVGSLVAPSCPRGLARFEMGFHYLLAKDAVLDENCQLQDPADIRAVVVRGPDLDCIGR
jgi:hypothetical protein